MGGARNEFETLENTKNVFVQSFFFFFFFFLYFFLICSWIVYIVVKNSYYIKLCHSTTFLILYKDIFILVFSRSKTDFLKKETFLIAFILY